MTQATAEINQISASTSRSFYQIAWIQFKKNRLAYLSMWFIILLAIIALLADFLAYNKPIVAVYKEKTYFPILYDYANGLGIYQWDEEMRQLNWKEVELSFAIWPPVRYTPEEIDLRNAQSVGPFDEQDINNVWERHWLGTDELGRDLLSGLIHGTRISLTVGIISTGLSAIIGIILGAFAGYFGDHRLKASRASILAMIIGIPLAYYYGFMIRAYTLSNALSQSFTRFLLHFTLSIIIFFGVLFAIWLLTRPLKRFQWFQERKSLWVDITISRLIELMVSIPTLLLIVSIAAIAKPSIFLVMAIIGLTSWTRIARFTRGELLRVRNLEYIQAAQVMGFSELRIIFRHALPNSLAPVFIAIAFGIAAAILIESSLSFLGIGVPPSTVTWGSLLAAARNSASAWWLAIFPGCAIFFTVTAFNLLGEGLRDALDPRLKT